MSERIHIPVKQTRVAQLLLPPLTAATAVASPPPVLVDGTLGMAGHARLLLDRAPAARLVGIDRDQDALRLAALELSGVHDRIDLVHAVFDEYTDVLMELGISRVSAVLLDLGVSSLQIDSPTRGFAYSRDTPLDMRMDQSRGLSAAEVVSDYSAKELSDVFRRYGEERYARRIADAVVRDRSARPITSTAQLSAIVAEAVPAAAQHRSGHPAKRVFQALRVLVNDELGALERVLPQVLDSLQVGGRVVVLSYQSLEDRLVKQTFAAATSAAVPQGLPVIPDEAQPRFKSLTRGAETADAVEVVDNPRSAPVRLRALERVREAA